MPSPGTIRDDVQTLASHLAKGDKSGPVAVIGQVLVLAVFALFDELFIKTNYKCPCFDLPNREERCGRSPTYSVLFIVLTTFLAGFLGTAALIGLTRKFMAMKATRKEKESAAAQDEGEGVSAERGYQGVSTQDIHLREIRSAQTGASQPQSHGIQRKKACFTVACSRRECIMVGPQFLLVALAWVAVLCIDGDYVACTLTCNPYGNNSCSVVRSRSENELPFSEEFNIMKRSVSQPIGISLAFLAAFMILGSLAIHCKTKCKDVKKWCAWRDDGPEQTDTEKKINKAKELLRDAAPRAYIVENV